MNDTDTNTNIARLIEMNEALAGSPRRGFLVASDSERVALSDAVEYVLADDAHAEKRLGAIARLASQGGIVLDARRDCGLGEYDDRREPGIRRYLRLVSELASGSKNVIFEHETRCDLCAGQGARVAVPAAYNEGARLALREMTGGLIAVGGGWMRGTHALIPLHASEASLALCDAVGELMYMSSSDGGAIESLAGSDAALQWEQEQYQEFMVRAVDDLWGAIEPCLTVCEETVRAEFNMLIFEYVLGEYVAPDESVVVEYDHLGAIESLAEVLRSLGETPDNILEASEGAERVMRRWFN